MKKRIPRDTDTFTYVNVNPKENITGDCVVRALVTATNKPWDDVLDELVALAHKYKCMPNNKKVYFEYLKQLGYHQQKQPKFPDGTKYTGREFAQAMTLAHESDIILAHIGTHHITAFVPDKNGVYKVHDVWNCSSRCVGIYFVKENKNNEM